MRGLTFAVVIAITSTYIVDGAAAERVDHPNLVKPSCKFPAPLEGSYQPKAPGYIVQLRGGSKAAVAGARAFAKAYRFKLDSVFDGIASFYTAEISQSALAGLRCESQVQLVEYNGVTTIN